MASHRACPTARASGDQLSGQSSGPGIREASWAQRYGLPTVGDLTVEEFVPDPMVVNGWSHTSTSASGIGLAYLLAATAMGSPVGLPLKFELIRLEVDLVDRLVDCPVNGALRLRAEGTHASLHLRRLASEAIGVSTAALLAHLRHGWNPLAGWPVDVDLPPVGAGIRPDLIFPIGQVQVAGEGRGRSQGRQVRRVTQSQKHKLAGLSQWSLCHNNMKVFMSWAWSNFATTRVDYFDPGEPSEVVPRSELIGSMRRQSEQLYVAARESGASSHRLRQVPVLGDWLTGPGRADQEIFLGVAEPEEIDYETATESTPRDPSKGSRETSAIFMEPVAQVGPLVTAVRPRGSDRGLAVLADDVDEAREGRS